MKNSLENGFTINGRINSINSIEGNNNVLSCQYTQDYSFIAAGFTDGLINLYNRNATKITELYDNETLSYKAPVTSIKHRPAYKNQSNSQILTTTFANGLVKCWDYTIPQCIYTINEKRQTFGLSYHRKFPKFLTYGDDSKIFMYDEETKMQEKIFQSSYNIDINDGHTSRIFSVCFKPNSYHEFLSGGWDNTVQFWDTRASQAFRHIFGPHICGEGIEISKSGREILTFAWQKQDPLQLWDYGSGKLIYNIEPDSITSQLYCGRYLTKDFILCGGSNQNLFRLIDLRTSMTKITINNFKNGVYNIDIGPKKQKSNKFDVNMAKAIFSSGNVIYEIDF